MAAARRGADGTSPDRDALHRAHAPVVRGAPTPRCEGRNRQYARDSSCTARGAPALVAAASSARFERAVAPIPTRGALAMCDRT
jgi:hypothetical protein